MNNKSPKVKRQNRDRQRQRMYFHGRMERHHMQMIMEKNLQNVCVMIFW